VRLAREALAADDARRSAPGAGGDFIVLSVRDNGVGISPDVRSQLFDPFFTTKAPGKGTGLGLTFVGEIARQAGGFVSVASEPRQGTTVSIYLPAAPPAAEASVTEPPAALSGPRRNLTVLLVEDEDSVREMIAALLRRAGHRVLPAASPSEAIALFGMYPRDIDLLLTDIVMPQMHGAELAAQLLAKRPHLAVLFVSAYPEVRPPRESAAGHLGFLAKPFSASQLLTAIAALDAQV